MANFYTNKKINIRKTWLLMSVFLVFIVFVGWIFGYAYNSPQILYFAFAFSLLMNFFAYWFSDKVALAMSGARSASKENHREFFSTVENLSSKAGLPMPKLYIMNSGQINAFATGRNAKHSAIAVTEGALSKLERSELEGVLAHELSHIGNRDILISSIAVVLAGLIAIMSDWFVRASLWGNLGNNENNRQSGGIVIVLGLIAAILAPIAATMIQLAISRKREFIADASGALLTNYPEGLARALEKILRDEVPMRHAHSGTAHLFISNPFKNENKTGWFVNLFMTHPPMKERIMALRNTKI